LPTKFQASKRYLGLKVAEILILWARMGRLSKNPVRNLFS
jgi:hypothetical protein